MHSITSPTRQDWIYKAAYAWLGLPVILFLLGWIRPLIAIPLVALLKDAQLIYTGQPDFRADSLPTAFMPNDCHDNFICRRQGIFVEWLMKSPAE